jgi:Ca-activated chloride channel family protein
MNAFQFQNPWCLLLLILPIAAALVAVRRRGRTAVLYSDASLIRTLPMTWRQWVKRALPALKFAGLALLVFALARPQKGLEDFRIRAEGIAITMCIDRSGSMQALDFQIEDERVDRLVAVKKVFRDFVLGTGRLTGRPNDMIGLIAFGGYADAKCPLTLDQNVLLEVLDSVEIPQPIYDSQRRMINRRILEEELSTAIGDAVLLGVDRLKDTQAKSKVLILLSDGENNAGEVDPVDAAEAARKMGIKIYAIGVGSTGTAPFPETDVFGRRVLARQRVVLDEDTLKMLAERTGGRYYNARNTQALTDIYSEIDKLEKSATEGRLYTRYRELFLWLLVPGLILILLELALATTWLRSLP